MAVRVVRVRKGTWLRSVLLALSMTSGLSACGDSIHPKTPEHSGPDKSLTWDTGTWDNDNWT